MTENTSHLWNALSSEFTHLLLALFSVTCRQSVAWLASIGCIVLSCRLGTFKLVNAKYFAFFGQWGNLFSNLRRIPWSFISKFSESKPMPTLIGLTQDRFLTFLFNFCCRRIIGFVASWQTRWRSLAPFHFRHGCYRRLNFLDISLSIVSSQAEWAPSTTHITLCCIFWNRTSLD